MVYCLFYSQGTKGIKVVERTIKMVPSRKAKEIRLFYKDQETGKPVQIVNGAEIGRTVGEHLEGLSKWYMLYQNTLLQEWSYHMFAS